MWSRGAGSSGSSAAAAAAASPSSSARPCAVSAPSPVTPSIAASSTDHATSGPCAAGRRGRSQRTRATRDGTPVPEASPAPGGSAATCASASQRVSTRWGSTIPGESALRALARRVPRADRAGGARAGQPGPSEVGPPLGGGLAGPRVVRVRGQPALRQVARGADREQSGRRGQLDHECRGALVDVQQQRDRPQLADPEPAGAEHSGRCRAPVVQQQLDAAYGVERGPGRGPGGERGVMAGRHQLRGYVDRSLARVGDPAEQLGHHGERPQSGGRLPDQRVVLQAGGRVHGPARAGADQPADVGARGLPGGDQGM